MGSEGSACRSRGPEERPAQTRPRLRRQGRGHPQGLHRRRHPLRGEDHCHQGLQRRVDQVLCRQRQRHHPQRHGQQRGGPRRRLRLLSRRVPELWHHHCIILHPRFNSYFSLKTSFHPSTIHKVLFVIVYVYAGGTFKPFCTAIKWLFKSFHQLNKCKQIAFTCTQIKEKDF